MIIMDKMNIDGGNTFQIPVKKVLAAGCKNQNNAKRFVWCGAFDQDLSRAHKTNPYILMQYVVPILVNKLLQTMFASFSWVYV